MKTIPRHDKESALASYAAILVGLVRATSVLAGFGLVALVVRHDPFKTWLDSYPVLLIVFLPCFGLSIYLSEKFFPAPEIARFFFRRELEPELSERHARVGCASVLVLMVLFVFANSRRSHEAPDDAEVYVREGRMVPLPYADDLGVGGEKMTLAEARLKRSDPVIEGIDWTYTTRGYRWLLMTPKSGWSVDWPEEEPADDGW